MKMHVWNYNKLINGKSIPLAEVKSIYQELLEEQAFIATEVHHTVEANDYVKLNQLLSKRSKVQSAIKEIELLHGEELMNSNTDNKQLSDTLNRYIEALSAQQKNISSELNYCINHSNTSAHSLLKRAAKLPVDRFNLDKKKSRSVGDIMLKKTIRGISKVSSTINRKY